MKWIHLKTNFKNWNKMRILAVYQNNPLIPFLYLTITKIAHKSTCRNAFIINKVILNPKKYSNFGIYDSLNIDLTKIYVRVIYTKPLPLR